MIARVHLLFLVALICVVQVQAAIYYVAPYGNDAASGGSGDPWRTIGHAASAISPGDTVNIRDGTYNEYVDITTPGSAAAPVLFQGDGENTLLYGNLNIEGAYVTVSNLTISPPGGYWAVRVAGTNNTLSGSTVTRYGATPEDQASAITIAGAFNTVTGCAILNLNDIDAFHVWGHDQVISGNIVSQLNQIAYGINHTDFVQTWGLDPTQVSYNIFVIGNTVKDSTCQLGNLEADDNPGFHDWIFENNLFINVENDFCAGLPNTAFFNNLFYHARVTLYTQDNYSSLGDRFVNNVFINDPPQQGIQFQSASATNLALVSNNYFATSAYGPVDPYGFFGSNAINGGDPKFIDAPNYDFHPQTGSVLIGVGLPIAGLTVDFDGQVRPAAWWAIGPYQ